MDIKKLYQLYQQHPQITTDSRDCPEGSIFLALKGASFNGNQFALQALEKGCSYAIVDEDTLKNGVYVEEYEKPQIWARHTCPSGILAGKNHKFSIVYGNNSNVDAYNVPLYFFVSS
jgi:UDP-N-acetylmuramyl pentapeptide synthase